MAVPLEASPGRGVDTGRGGARRCSRVLVVDRERERAEGIGTEGEIRESERVRGGRVASPGSSGGKQGGRRWPKQGGGGRGAWPRAPGACPSSCPGRKTTGKALVGWAGQGGNWAGWWAARVRPGRLYSFYYYYFLSVLF